MCVCALERDVVNSTVIDRLHYIAEGRIQQKEADEARAFEPRRLHDGNSIAKANFGLLEQYHLDPSSLQVIMK